MGTGVLGLLCHSSSSLLSTGCFLGFWSPPSSSWGIDTVVPVIKKLKLLVTKKGKLAQVAELVEGRAGPQAHLCVLQPDEGRRVW